MALKFIGERTVGTLNGMKSGFVKDDLYRVYDAGILVPGGVSVDHGDFVSWDGTKWVREADIKIARSDEITNTNSSIAPEYTKTTYPANSYVMYGGVLYTNPSAIGTAEDWNPEHWTQTTVAEMMAGDSTGYTQRNVNVSVEDNVYPLSGVSNRSVTVASINQANNFPWEITIDNDCTDAVVILRATVYALAPPSININRIDGTPLTLYGEKGQIVHGSIEDAGCGYEFIPYYNGIGEGSVAAEVIIRICGDIALLYFTA